MVPLALINLTSKIEANWDLTLVKASVFIAFLPFIAGYTRP